uniref:Uncharacterized protein n=1 Tax=Podoviridae sp. ctylN24 TaxID=2827756 RepID=A0A8S5SXS5_9CAUD|nr:MAG TPA: hypothetical protein [Podoviridae sp. ctylN24]
MRRCAPRLPSVRRQGKQHARQSFPGGRKSRRRHVSR